jgi:NitT/TauT family transport system permease protein
MAERNGWARVVVPPLLTIIVLLLVWEVVLRLDPPLQLMLARPSAIAATLVDRRDILGSAALATLQITLAGFGLAVLVGVGLALLIARFSLVERALYPLVILFQTVPKVALAPIFILWFGFGLTPKVLLITVIAFFPVTLNLLAGFRASDPNLELLMRTVGASPTRTLLRIKVPSALPQFFAGMKIAITFAIIGAIVAEFAGASNGLGYLIQFGSTQLDTPLLFAALILVSAIGVALYYGVVLLERLALPWAAADAIAGA